MAGGPEREVITSRGPRSIEGVPARAVTRAADGRARRRAGVEPQRRVDAGRPRSPATTGPTATCLPTEATTWLDDVRAVAVVRALQIPLVRDAAVAACTGSRPAAAEALWAALARGTPDPEAAEPAALLALMGLLHGDGALANVALQRAEAAWPGHHLTATLRGLAAAGIRPSELRACLVGAPLPGLRPPQRRGPQPHRAATSPNAPLSPTASASAMTTLAAMAQDAHGDGHGRGRRGIAPAWRPEIDVSGVRSCGTPVQRRLDTASCSCLSGRSDAVAQLGEAQASATISSRSVCSGASRVRAIAALAGGDQHGGVAGAARRDHGRDRLAGHARGRPRSPRAPRNRCPLPRLQTRVPARLGGRQRQQVRLGQVADVDVVADAGAVRGRPVGAVHRDRLALAGGDLQHQRDQVGFDECRSPNRPYAPATLK